MTDYSAIAEKYHASLADYKNEDMFSLGYQWTDKPHRHVFDLCKHLQAANEAITALQAELEFKERAERASNAAQKNVAQQEKQHDTR